MSSTKSNTQVRESIIFNSCTKEIPSISITMLKKKKSSSDVTQIYTSKNMSFYQSFGLLKVIDSPNLPYVSKLQKNINTRISMTDFMGKSNSQILISKIKLNPLRRKVKKKFLFDLSKEKNYLRKPASPNVMDQNVKLRLLLESQKKTASQRRNIKKLSSEIEKGKNSQSHNTSFDIEF